LVTYVSAATVAVPISLRDALPILCCLCPLHHRMHHAGLLQIDGDPPTPDGLVFSTHNRTRILAPNPPTPPDRLPPPQRTYQHPIGEPVEWKWLYWDHPDNTITLN